jgi:type IV secretory pathway VirB10-like protein
MAPAPLPPLITRPMTQPRQNKQVPLVVGGVVVVLLAGMIVWRMSGPRPVISREPRERLPTEQTTLGAPAPPSEDLRLPTSYARVPVASPPPPASTVRQSTPPQAPVVGAKSTPPSSGPLPGFPAPPPPPGPPPNLPPPGVIGGQPGPAPALVPGIATRGQGPKAPPERWFSAVVVPSGDILQPPLPEDPADKERAEAQSKLFPKAVWEVPADPYRVLYMDQLVQVQLYTNINSDFPGTVQLKATEAVMDRWGHGHVVIPLDTTFIAQQQGQTTYNQERVPVSVTHAILPNGTTIKWVKSQAGDVMGANAIPAEVDNHYGKLLLGVGLQAVLNIGLRVPLGSTSGFQPNLGQEFAQEATQGINQAGQRLLSQFQVRPTLTQYHGFPATISFSENVSFQTKPEVIKK